MSKPTKRPLWPWAAVPVAILVGLAAGRLWVNSPTHQLSASAAQALAVDGMTSVNHDPAPNFHLVNQTGQPVSLSQFRGKAVVITFLDPVCWLDCPLEAQEMVDMNKILGPKLSSRVALIGIVANPQYHSVADVEAFDEEHGLTHVPNWTYATSPSVATLQQVWHKYFEYVHAPKFGMIQHTDVFWLITPKGQEAWLSDPSAHTRYLGGTSQLLATYVARMLHQSLPATLPKVAGLGRGIWQPMGLSYALSAQSASEGWALYPYQGYRGLAWTASGGSVWTSATPVAMSERGGMEVDPIGPSAAWTMIGAYGFQLDPMVRVTANGGKSWGAPWPVPGAIPPRAIQPLAATSGSKAWVLANHALMETTTGGAQWTSVSSTVPWLKNATLSAQNPSSLWAAGEVAAQPTASLWHFTAGHGGQSVPVPVPADWKGHRATVGAPQWAGPLQGGVGIVQEEHGRESLVWDTTQNGGLSWQTSSPPVTITGNLAAAVSIRGNTVYALSPSAGRTRVVQWRQGQRQWSAYGSLLPEGTDVALAVDSAGSLWVMSKTGSVPLVWTSTNGGASWSKSGPV